MLPDEPFLTEIRELDSDLLPHREALELKQIIEDCLKSATKDGISIRHFALE